VTGFALAHAGFVALCLAMQRHHEQVLGQRRIPPARRRCLAAGGWALLAASLAPPVQAAGWGLGLVVWTGLLTAAALPIVVLLAYRPRWVMATAGVAVLGGLVSVVAG
jgi:hypothetical protein